MPLPSFGVFFEPSLPGLSAGRDKLEDTFPVGGERLGYGPRGGDIVSRREPKGPDASVLPLGHGFHCLPECIRFRRALCGLGQFRVVVLSLLLARRLSKASFCEPLHLGYSSAKVIGFA